MTQVDETTQEEYYEQMPFSAEEWAQTPRAVQEFVVSTVARLQVVEAELATLRERVNRNSSNSSRPPSSDGPGVPPKTSKRAKSGRKQGLCSLLNRAFWWDDGHANGPFLRAQWEEQPVCDPTLSLL